MSNIALVWDPANSRADWQIVGGRTRTGNLLTTAVIISLFTDRVAQPDYVPDDRTGDRRGWWSDTFDGLPIGSRLWQLRRRKIANRQDLINEATRILQEALQWLIDAGIAASITIKVTAPPAGPRSQGTTLAFFIQVIKPTGPAPSIDLLWKAY